jgi:trans-2,3-dihydro-3-hydroxyanthranilate isomerase
MRLQFQTVDVFTGKQFVGNPLAVVLNAEALSTGQMQAIAAEFNLAETTFVRPPKDPAHTAEVRIFTPRSEMPFAGHPNIGTAFALARAGVCYGRPIGRDRVIFEEKAGLVSIEILKDGTAVVGARLASPQPLSVQGRGRTRGIGLRIFARRYRDRPSSPLHRFLRRTVHSRRTEESRRTRRGKPERRCVPA